MQWKSARVGKRLSKVATSKISWLDYNINRIIQNEAKRKCMTAIYTHLKLGSAQK